jgi:hypothetical protein
MLTTPLWIFTLLLPRELPLPPTSVTTQLQTGQQGGVQHLSSSVFASSSDSSKDGRPSHSHSQIMTQHYCHNLNSRDAVDPGELDSKA